MPLKGMTSKDELRNVGSQRLDSTLAFDNAKSSVLANKSSCLFWIAHVLPEGDGNKLLAKQALEEHA